MKFSNLLLLAQLTSAANSGYDHEDHDRLAQETARLNRQLKINECKLEATKQMASYSNLVRVRQPIGPGPAGPHSRIRVRPPPYQPGNGKVNSYSHMTGVGIPGQVFGRSGRSVGRDAADGALDENNGHENHETQFYDQEDKQEQDDYDLNEDLNRSKSKTFRPIITPIPLGKTKTYKIRIDQNYVKCTCYTNCSNYSECDQLRDCLAEGGMARMGTGDWLWVGGLAKLSALLIHKFSHIKKPQENEYSSPTAQLELLK